MIKHLNQKIFNFRLRSVNIFILTIFTSNIKYINLYHKLKCQRISFKQGSSKDYMTVAPEAVTTKHFYLPSTKAIIKLVEVMELGWTISNPKRWCYESAALNMSANLETQQWPQDWKRSVFIPIPKKGNPKECSNYCTIVLISHSSKEMLKILQSRLR